MFNFGIFDIDQPSDIMIPVWFIFVPFSSVFFILEFINYKLNKNTLILDLFKGIYSPLIAIFVANVLGIILFEWLNFYMQVWFFGPWPYPDIKMLGLPLSVVIAWSSQFFAFLPGLRLIYDKKEEKIW